MWICAEANATTQTQRRNPRSCETPGCSVGCAYAYSCHEERMGRRPAASWPGVGLLLLVIVAAVFSVF